QLGDDVDGGTVGEGLLEDGDEHPGRGERDEPADERRGVRPARVAVDHRGDRVRDDERRGYAQQGGRHDEGGRERDVPACRAGVAEQSAVERLHSPAVVPLVSTVRTAVGWRPSWPTMSLAHTRLRNTQ